MLVSDISGYITLSWILSILLLSLHSVTRPIVPSAQCVPAPVENDEIMACICTDDFCNGLDGPTSTAVRKKTPKPSQRKTTARPKRPQSGGGRGGERMKKHPPNH